MAEIFLSSAVILLLVVCIAVVSRASGICSEHREETRYLRRSRDFAEEHLTECRGRLNHYRERCRQLRVRVRELRKGDKED